MKLDGSVGDRCTGRYGPLYSRKLHMRVRRARTSCETSLMILALSLGERVVNHFAKRCTCQSPVQVDG